MGQEAIHRGAYHGELRLIEPAKMIDAIGFRHPWNDLLAMQPDFNFGFETAEHAAEFIRRAQRLRAPSGEPLWHRARQEGNSVNLGMVRPDDVMHERVIVLEAERAGASSQRLSLDTLGISAITRDPGTGYHQPLGSLIWYGDPTRGDPKRKEIESVHVRDMIMQAVRAMRGASVARHGSV